jgi:hypothetical protein
MEEENKRKPLYDLFRLWNQTVDLTFGPIASQKYISSDSLDYSIGLLLNKHKKLKDKLDERFSQMYKFIGDAHSNIKAIELGEIIKEIARGKEDSPQFIEPQHQLVDDVQEYLLKKMITEKDSKGIYNQSSPIYVLADKMMQLHEINVGKGSNLICCLKEYDRVIDTDTREKRSYTDLIQEHWENIEKLIPVILPVIEEASFLGGYRNNKSVGTFSEAARNLVNVFDYRKNPDVYLLKSEEDCSKSEK